MALRYDAILVTQREQPYIFRFSKYDAIILCFRNATLLRYDHMHNECLSLSGPFRVHCRQQRIKVHVDRANVVLRLR